MPRRPKTHIEQIIEALRIADLRLRIGPDLPNAASQRRTAVAELTDARDLLAVVIENVMKGTYPPKP